MNFKIGQTVSTKYFYDEVIGKVVSIINNNNSIGVDFAQILGSWTHDLNSILKKPTGRYFTKDELTIIPGDWDE